MIRILLTTMSYPAPEGYKGGSFIHSQAVALKKRGYSVAVLYLDMRSIRRKRRLGYSTYELDEIKVYRYAFPCGPMKHLLYRLAKVLALHTYQKILPDFGKPDLLHGHFWQGGLLAKTIEEKTNIPYVVTEHGSNVLMERLSRVEYKLACQTYTDAVVCLAVSRALKRKMEEMTKQPVMVVPNILPDYMRCTVSSKKKHRTEKFVFFSCGNLVPGKRFDLLLKAYAALPQNVRQISCLRIAGEGPERQTLEELTKDLQIERQVYFLGRVDNRQLPMWYAQSDCFVLASDFETFGVVYIEAMACGLPVIATRCGGPEDFVLPENGLLIEKNNQKALTEAMENVYQDFEKYDSKRIVLMAMKQYGEKTIVDKLRAVYRKVCGEEEGKGE